MDHLLVEIVTPSGRVFQGEAGGIQAPGVEGSFEVLAGHAPMIAAFEVGTIRVTDPAGKYIRFATSGGFLEVIDNNVSVIAQTAEISSAIDLERAKAAETRALERLARATDEEEKKRMEAALTRARNRVRLAMGTVGQGQKG
jgi:F-type H+-transporting ATPase subunit epsilon